MERKSIGAFLAALRREQGLTQKELAEQLNVSDKTISRWERDEGAPDLYLVPVLADIFGISCDELLRGERAAEQRSSAEPPRQNLLLAAAQTRYRNRTLVSAGLAAGGLIAAMAINLGFNRAYIGFFTACVFFVAALVCQYIFANNARLAAESTGAEAERYLLQVWRLRSVLTATVLLLFAFCLPLFTMVGDAYWGLMPGSWLRYGLLYAALTALPLLMLGSVLDERQILQIGGDAARKLQMRRAANQPLRKRCMRLLTALLVVTFICHVSLTGGFSTRHLAQGTVFDDYDSFTRYMSVDVPSYIFEPHVAPLDSAVEIVVQEFDSATGEPYRVYYDAAGNIISEEQALTRQIKNRAGEVLCEYVHRNSSVVRIIYSGDEDMLPITTYTQGDLYAAQQRLQACNLIFCGLYLAEMAAVAAYFALKRVR